MTVKILDGVSGEIPVIRVTMESRYLFFPGMKTLCPRKFLFIIALFLLFFNVNAQTFSFAHVSDTHVGGSTGAEDLIRTVEDINSQTQPDFVIVTGDITEFGSGDELRTAKKILDKLNKPWYVVPGNHDSKWSESGCNDFVSIFGSETFAFEKNGYLFLGTSSGPDMRMGPGLVPREQLVWLDSILNHLPRPGQPIIFVNHYPLDESLSNSAKIISLLKKRNIKAELLGHGHANKLFDFQGIPGIMGRSDLSTNRVPAGYNMVTIRHDSVFYAERNPGTGTQKDWLKMALGEQTGNKVRVEVSEPGALNPEQTQTQAKAGTIALRWEIQEESDIGAGIASKGKICVYTTTKGQIVARDRKNGALLWSAQTGGKIFSTPALKGNRVVCPSTDGQVRCLDLRSGKVIWEFRTNKPMVVSPVIRKGRVFLGSSEGKFRALDLKSGKLIWQFDSVRNFVETKPLVYKKGVYFGSWGNTFYALDRQSGKLLWKREKYNNRMLSPAAVWPVAADGKIFIVAPDRHFTALNAATGKEIWDSGKYSCRESVGISKNGRLVYIKNMTEGNVDAFSTKSDTLRLVWECKANLGYEIAPSPITESRKFIFIPTASGKIVVIGKKTHEVAWTFRLSEALVNYILPVGNHTILFSTFDGIAGVLVF